MLQRALAAAAITAACAAIPAAAQAATPLTSQRPDGRSPHQPTRPRETLAQRSAGRSAATVADGSSRPTRSSSPRATRRSGTAARSAHPHPRTCRTEARRWSRPRSTGGRSVSGTRPAAPSEYSAPAQLETGLLTNADWTAKWIAAPADDLNLSGAPAGSGHEDGTTRNMPAITRYLRTIVTLASAPSERAPAVHGRRRGRHLRQRHAGHRHQGAPRRRRERLAEGAASWRSRALKPGANTIAVQVKNRLNGRTAPRRRAASSLA